jgi:uncharacterized protein (TIGR02145 family)
MKKNNALWFTNTGTDKYGFSALPGGARQPFGFFFNFSYQAFFWSATQVDLNNAVYRYLSFNNGNVDRIYSNKSAGGSVRCLKD